MKYIRLQALVSFFRERRGRNTSNFRGILLRLSVFFLLSGAASVFLVYQYFILPPDSFPEGIIISIEDGKTLREVATLLEEKGLIRRNWALQGYMSTFGTDRMVISGDYHFSEKEDMISIASRLTEGEFRIQIEAITIVEGSTVIEIADRLDGRLPYFSKEEFIRLALPFEGSLFPDTYSFAINTNAETALRMMRKNFYRQIAEVEEEIKNSEFTLREIITLASLIEKEASNTEDRRLISGVLHNRLAIDMPLQVDVVFLYIMNKNSYQLTHEDLAFDSPYNTYRHVGLPPGPIGNPGMDSIRAALYPTESSYLYFLADRRGNTYFAEDFDGHKENRRRYMDS